jgi:hypothetical protein
MWSEFWQSWVMNRSRRADAFKTIHEALTLCRDLAIDDANREAEVVSPAARYRLEKVQEALTLARRGLEPGTTAAKFLMDIAVGRLAALPVEQWGEGIHYLMEALETEVSPSGYNTFLKQLRVEIEERLKEGRGEESDQ